jgi:hypothetical protein
LHLSSDPDLLDQGVAQDDPLLLTLQRIGSPGWLHLHWVPSIGPYRKIIPFLQANGYAQGNGDDLFLTVDDDTLYPPRFVEYLLRHYATYGCIVAHRGRRIQLALNAATQSAFEPYNSWHDGLHAPRLSNFPTGRSGVLDRRSWFPSNVHFESAIRLMPNDDIWLRWLTALQAYQL